ncbi:MAG: acyl carrier protein [Polyangiaceae bacterium]|nr:acyl carrier protein [Polyangiaceae bacterium]
MQEIEAAVRQFIVKNFVMARSRGAIAGGDSLMEAGIVDSTGVLELTGFLEEEFEITVEDAELIPENLDSIDNIVGYVARKTGMS